MSYEEFLEKVRAGIQKYLPDEYASNEARIVKRMINNGGFYYGLSVRRQGSNTAPLLELSSYYEKYMKGHNIEDMLREIAATYYEKDVHTPVINDDDFRYENIKNKIFVEICNAKKNQKELKNAPHQIREDLAERYYIRFVTSETEIGKMRIHNDHLQLWNISQDQLKKQAWENMKCFMKPSLQSLRQIVGEYVDVEFLDRMQQAEKIYVLSNEQMMYGAAYLFDDFSMKSLAEILNDDLLVLPSSTHEVLIIKCNNADSQRTVADLKEIVKEINRDYLSPEEFLSDEVYLYEKDTHQLSIANDGEQQLGMSMNM